MSINLSEQDKHQRQLALDASKSFIVQAPAGSGKTELLIQRFLTLLNHVKLPEEVIAITFTKKAANEMRARVIKALKYAQSEMEPEASHASQTWKLAKQVLQRDQKFGWNLINNPNQLRIQTIDSLCAYLTKQLPILSHFGSQPDIADDPKFLYREAAKEVLTHVEEEYEWSQAISQLLLHLDNDLNKLHDLLVNLLEKRDQWLPYIQINAHDNEIRNRLEHHLESVIAEGIASVHENFPGEFANELTSIARFAADNMALKNIESDILACRDLLALPGKGAQDKRAWSGLTTLLLTKSFSWRKRLDEDMGFPALTRLKNPQEKILHLEYRQRLITLITNLSDNEALRLALTELFFLPEATYHDSQWEILKSLLYILKIAAAQLRVTFQSYGQIDFIENVQAALAALGQESNPTDLALALDYQINHILIDEFQDTSFTQFQLLEKLTTGWETQDGRTLFIVGDPMQSIYRFREAEVGLFIRMRKNGIGNIKLIPLTLSVNFRSTSNLVEWNNVQFQKIFPCVNDVATGAVTYSPSAAKQMPAATTHHSSVDIKGFLNADDAAQADYIVRLIQDTKKENPNEKIAILVRSRTHLTYLIPALKRLHIPFHAVDIDPLASRQIIQDLLSLTCAMLHPADRISWLSVLRAPWCGLSLADLLILAKDNPYAAIYEQMTRTNIIKQLSEDGQKRLAKIFPLLKNKIVERERYDLRTWIENTWVLLGGPACLQDYADMDDANAYFKLLDEFSRNNPLLNLDKLKEKMHRLYANKSHDDDSLQIMTIHAAKGLEFDTVILPHLERKMPNDDKSLLLWIEQPLMSDQIALLLAPIHATGNEKDSIYEYIHRRQKIRSDYETDRLFYVAATRAKKRLHFLFDITQNEKGHFKVEADSFLSKIWPLIENQKDHIILSPPITENVGTKENIQHRYTMRVASSWDNPIKDKQFNIPAIHQKSSGFQLIDNNSQWIGIVVHRLLQLISENSLAWWQDHPHQYTYIKHQLTQAGILPDAIEEATNTAHQIIQNATRDARGIWLLTHHEEAKSELAISAIIDGELEHLIIDRTFVDDNGTRWIIDYKTTAFFHDNLEEFLRKEQKKHWEKMYKYYQAIKLMDNRPIKMGLYFPTLPAWKEWEIEK